MSDTTDDYKQLSIYKLKKDGLFKPGHWASGNIVWNNDQFTVWYAISTMLNEMYMNLNYGDYNYRVKLTTTPCYIGGIRFWFICPLIREGKPCQKRIAILYKGGNYFGCRKCYGLQYHSQNISYRKPIYAALHVLNTYDRIGKVEKRKQWYAGKPTRHFDASARLWHRAQPYIKQLR